MNDFYKGYEGEPELRVSLHCAGHVEELSLWDGFFSQIMDTLEPGEHGWTGLAAPYQLHEGWYSSSPWRIENLSEALEQWTHVDATRLSARCAELHAAVLDMFQRAARDRCEVYISYE